MPVGQFHRSLLITILDMKLMTLDTWSIHNKQGSTTFGNVAQEHNTSFLIEYVTYRGISIISFNLDACPGRRWTLGKPIFTACIFITLDSRCLISWLSRVFLSWYLLKYHFLYSKSKTGFMPHFKNQDSKSHTSRPIQIIL